jgi:tRNA G18 (ribose-2'-O)-methylase SpoU
MARYEPISDEADPRIAPYRSLRDRELRKAFGGSFIAEGEVVLAVLAAQSRYRISSLLLSDRRVDGVASLCARIGETTPIYVARHELMQKIVGFPIHRGVLALGERGAPDDLDGLLRGTPARSVALGLAGVVNHDNVGAIFRNAAAFGVDAVALDGETCDPLYRKALRVSVGGSLVVPFARAATEAALVTALERAGYVVFALAPGGAINIGAAPPAQLPPRVALLLGAEGPGLRAETLAACRTLRIPMRAGWDSLNVGVACGIALFWLGLKPFSLGGP